MYCVKDTTITWWLGSFMAWSSWKQKTDVNPLQGFTLLKDETSSFFKLTAKDKKDWMVVCHTALIYLHHN